MHKYRRFAGYSGKRITPAKNIPADKKSFATK